MNRLRWNERGSLPLALVMIMFLMGTVTIMSSMVLSDKSSEMESRNFIQESLLEDSLFELIYFEIASRIDNNYYGVENEPILNILDLDMIEQAVKTRLESEYAEYTGDKMQLTSFRFQQENMTAFDLCNSINACTFDLTFEIGVMNPDKELVITFTNLQWTNVGSLESPIYQLSTLHSKWRFEERSI